MLKIFNLNIYVVNARKLISLVQRLSKTLSFTPFQRFAAKTMVGCSKYTLELHSNPEFMHDFDKAMRLALYPGPHLDFQNLRTINSLDKSLDALFSTSKEPKEVGFYDWSRHIITIAASDGVYGSSNPFLDPQLEEAYW